MAPSPSYPAAVEAAELWLDPWSDLRGKSLSRTAHDQMELPLCKQHSSSAPPCILSISVLLDKAPKCWSCVCSLAAAWQGGMVEAAGMV